MILMDYFELVEISTLHLELTTPAAPEKLWTIGQYLDLDNEKQVIDFGCGYGRQLELWGKDFGVSGIGIEIHDHMCKMAVERIKRAGLSERISIHCENALNFPFERNHFNVASCLRASFIWGGYRKAIKTMKEAIKPGGKLVVGEPYYVTDEIPQELLKFEGDLHTEYQLVQISRDEGFDVEFVVRASRDDWDRFASSNWYGLLKWIKENPDHPKRQYVKAHLRKKQEMYFRFQRNLEGWAVYVLTQ